MLATGGQSLLDSAAELEVLEIHLSERNPIPFLEHFLKVIGWCNVRYKILSTIEIQQPAKAP